MQFTSPPSYFELWQALDWVLSLLYDDRHLYSLREAELLQVQALRRVMRESKP